MRWLLVAPHPDDICLSMGGTIAVAKSTTTELHMITVFTIGGHAPYLSGPTDTQTVSATRKKEELHYCQQYGIKPIYLEQEELIMKLPEADIFNMSTEDYPDREACLNETDQLIRTGQYDLVFFPGSIGSHVEHKLLFKLATTTPSAYCYYEDLPYALDYPDEAIKSHFESNALVSIMVSIDEVIEQKLDDLRQYKSQIGQEEVAKCAAYAQRLGQSSSFERLWGSTESIQVFQNCLSDHA